MSGPPFDAVTLVSGAAAGPILRLDEPLSFWGGLDPATGAIIDRWHPQRGARVRGRMLMMPGGRGSSSGSATLAEAASMVARADFCSGNFMVSLISGRCQS